MRKSPARASNAVRDLRNARRLGHIVRHRNWASALGILFLAGCASTSETPQGKTATEQLLLARATDRAAQGLWLPIPQGSRVFVDTSRMQIDTAGYATSALRSGVSAAGFALVDSKAEADAVMEVRAGAVSMEQMRRVFGLPAMTVPINETFNVVSIPEVSLYSRRDRIGVAEFSAFLYEPRTGAPLALLTPMTGEYRIQSHKLLMMLTWGQQRVAPGEHDPGDSWREF